MYFKIFTSVCSNMLYFPFVSFMLYILSHERHLVYTYSVEELKWINYEVDISVTPVKREEINQPTVHITSRNGQEFQCILPQLNEEEISEKEVVNEKDVDILELLKPMKSGSCLSKSKDWWTYEFCFGHSIKQFHVEDGEIIGEVITLGLYESDIDWNNETADQERFKHTKQKYHSQYYTNGTKCDITGQPRNAEVRIYCEEDAFDYIYRVDEPGTCSYVITVHTSRLCAHPLLKPLPSNKAHPIKCHPVLNEEQYSNYLQKLTEEKALAEAKRSQWLTNQQERLQVMKNENLSPIDDKAEKFSSESSKTSKSVKKSSETVREFLLQEYEKEMEKLKTSLPPEKFASVKSIIQKQFDTILNEAKEDLDSELSEEAKDLYYSEVINAEENLDSVKNVIEKQFETILNEAAKEDIDPELSAETKDVHNSDAIKVKKDGKELKDVSLAKLMSVLNGLLERHDKAEKEAAKATKELNKGKTTFSDVSGSDPEDNSNPDNEKKDTNQNKDNDLYEDPLKVTSSDHSRTAVLDDDKLQVRIRRLDRKSSDTTGKLHEMDFEQRKKLEQAVKEKLEKAGLDTGGRRIEVKIITAGYYDNEDGKDFQSLTDEETDQFQNMIMALLTGQQEAVQEMKRHKKLEESYKFTWDDNEEMDNKED